MSHYYDTLRAKRRKRRNQAITAVVLYALAALLTGLAVLLHGGFVPALGTVAAFLALAALVCGVLSTEG